MKQFTLASVSKLGDMDETYGQKYWCQVNEQLEDVSFNSKSDEFNVGDIIEAEEVLLKQTKKGKDYHQLRKVRVVSGAVNPIYTVPPADPNSEPVKQVDLMPPDMSVRLDRIEKKLDQLLLLKEDEALEEQINDL